MKKPQLKFKPRWEGPIQWHAANVCMRYHRSLFVVYELEDLMQEAYIVFLECVKNYGTTVDNPRWFMALFSLCLANRFNTLYKKRPRYILNAAEVPVAGELENLGYALRLVTQMPYDLQLAVNMTTRNATELFLRSRVTRRKLSKLKAFLS
jgi:DNA-directed RNA polymerase specialized sigma24 family protein